MRFAFELHEQPVITRTPELFSVTGCIPWNYLRVRRYIEISVIIVAAPLLILIMAVIALLIWLQDRKPVLFIQKRPGRNGRIFNLFKFRTMHLGSDSALIKGKADKRVTRFGAFLRRLKLDELPQLVNVLKGEMSVIGPRPVPVDYYNDYLECIPCYPNRHIIKPGITGLAQVELGYTTTIEEEEKKLMYDLKYINAISPVTDLKIIIKTFFH